MEQNDAIQHTIRRMKAWGWTQKEISSALNGKTPRSDVYIWWTEEEDKLVRKLASEGWTALKIGLKFGRSRNSVIGYCARKNIQLLNGHKHFTKEEDASLRKLALEGYSRRQISEKLGRSQYSISTYCRTKKIKTFGKRRKLGNVTP